MTLKSHCAFVKFVAVIAMAALDGCVYVLGGSDGEKLMSSVERYTPAINQWQSIASLPIALSRCQAVGSSGQLYIAGTHLFICVHP